MKTKEAFRCASQLLILGCILVQGVASAFAGETDRQGTTQSSADCSEGNGRVIVRSEIPICPGCSTDNVEIYGQEFGPDTYCICIGRKSITIGPGVIIRKGATIIFSAPKVYIKSYFNAESGSLVLIETEEPPPPPG